MKQSIKHKIKNIKEKLTTREARDFVVERLNKIQELPDKGYCLGQSVSSAIVEFLSLADEITPVYNDIDIFVAEVKLFSFDATGAEKIGYEKKIEDSPEDELFLGIHNGEEYIGLSSGVFHEYSIEDTSRNLLINTTNINIHGSGDHIGGPWEDTPDINYTKIKESALKHILSSFDINTTKSGFVIEEENSELIIDESFLLFLATKQIEIESMPHPVNAYLRALKKQEEMDVYFDADKYGRIIEGQIDIINNVHLEMEKNVLNNMPSELKVFSKKRTISSPKYLELYHKYKHHFQNLKLVESEGKFLVTPVSSGAGEKLIERFIAAGGDVIFGTEEGGRDLAREKMREFSKGIHSRIVDPPYENLSRITAEEDEYFKYYDENINKEGNLNKSKISEEILRGVSRRAREGVIAGSILNTMFSLPEVILAVEGTKKSTLQTLGKVFDLHLDIKGEVVSDGRRYYKSKVDFISQARNAHLSPDDIEKYIKEVKKILNANHPIFTKRLMGDIQDIKKVTSILEVVNEESKTSMDFIGKIEVDIIKFIADGGWDQFSEPGFVEKMMAEERAKKRVELREDIPKEARFFKSGTFEAELLTTGVQLEKEGEVMNHCVGGYAGKVKNKNALIFKVFGIKEGGEKIRATMELSKTNNISPEWEEDWYNAIEDESDLQGGVGEYRIAQLHGNSNQEVKMGKEMIRLLLQINKKFTIIPEEVTAESIRTAFSRHFETRPAAFDLEELAEEINRQGAIKKIPSILSADIESASITQGSTPC